MEGIQWNPVREFAGRTTGFGRRGLRVILHGALQQGDASRRPPRAGAGLVGSTSPADAAPWESLSLPPPHRITPIGTTRLRRIHGD